MSAIEDRRRALQFRIYQRCVIECARPSIVAQELAMSEEGIRNALDAFRQNFRTWYGNNKTFQIRVQNYLKQCIDQIDYLIEVLWGEYDSIKNEDMKISTRIKILDAIRKAYVDRSGMLGASGLSIKDIEIKTQLDEIDETLKQLRERQQGDILKIKNPTVAELQ